VAVLRVSFPSIARHTHMCKHVLLLRFTLHHMFIVGVWFRLFLYNCVPYRIIELNYLNLRLDIYRHAMNPHDMAPSKSLEAYVRASPLSLAQQLQMIF
jgi:hypothetical protein